MVTAIILSGGTGTRMGTDIPKQYLIAGGKPVIAYVIDTFEKSDAIDSYVIVAAPAYRDLIQSLLPAKSGFKGFADPGENRQLSIYNALCDVKKLIDADGAIIHDAARPFVTVEDIDECLKALEDHDGAMPVLPMKDTVYFSRSGRKVDELLNRNWKVRCLSPWTQAAA